MNINAAAVKIDGANSADDMNGKYRRQTSIDAKHELNGDEREHQQRQGNPLSRRQSGAC
jgi:hypothetical protein